MSPSHRPAKTQGPRLGAQPTTTVAVTQDAYGPTDALAMREVAVAALDPDEALVAVRAAGVDPSVWHLATGTPYLVRLMGYGLVRPRNPVVGTDVAGEVVAVGSDVTDLAPGDAVLGAARGSFAAHAKARTRNLVKKPEALRYAEAAALPTSGTTALQAVRDKAEVAAGDRVLVVGAGGGVGTFAVQLAALAGAEVTGVCSASKAALVLDLGAADVIDYTKEDPFDGRRRYDVVIDTAGNRPLPVVRRGLEPDGRLVIVGGEGGGRWAGGVGRLVRASGASRRGGQRLVGLMAAHRRDDLAELVRLVSEGSVRVALHRTFSLDEAAAAIAYVREGHAQGKISITV